MAKVGSGKEPDREWSGALTAKDLQSHSGIGKRDQKSRGLGCGGPKEALYTGKASFSMPLVSLPKKKQGHG